MLIGILLWAVSIVLIMYLVFDIGLFKVVLATFILFGSIILIWYSY